MAKRKTVWEDCDILVVGGGMAGTGASYEARYWGRDMRIICAEKANIDRSGAVADAAQRRAGLAARRSGGGRDLRRGRRVPLLLPRRA